MSAGVTGVCADRLVSVVVPTRDRIQLMHQAVRAVVTQDCDEPIECIVVFDQSEPVPIDIALPPGRSVRTIVNDRTPGLAGGRNAGILAATGRYVAFCDDDDEWLPSRLRHQFQLLRRHPDVAAVACGIKVVYGDRVIDRLPPTEPLTFDHLLVDRHMEVNPCTVLVDRQHLIDHVGLVDETIPGSYGEDYEWLLRLTRTTVVPSVPLPLVIINWHTGSFFADRYRTVLAALHYLLARHPELAGSKRGFARIAGQIAFAHAMLGERATALRWVGRTLAASIREKRAYAAFAVATRVVSGQRVIAMAHSRGRGI